MKKIVRLLLASAMLLTSVSANAGAILGAGGLIFGTGGNVSVEVLSSESGFTNEINLFYAFPDLTMMTFIGIDNETLPDSVDLGSFALGTELVFGIITDQNNIFVMGDASRNPDNTIHANVFATATSTGFEESWIVGFEDLFGGGDKDFNDAFIRVDLAEAIPEPTTLALLGLGLLGLGFARRIRS